MSEETTQEQQEAPKKRSGISPLRLIVFVLLIGLIAAGGYFFLQGGAEAKAVALVNGEKISQARYDDYQAQVAAVFQLQNQDVNSEEVKTLIKQQTIDDLIAETIILQKAREANIVADVELVDAQLEQTKAQFADEAAFQTELKSQGFTEGSFRETLIRQNIFQQYINGSVDLSGAVVEEAEIQEFYDQAAASSENIPELESVRDQIQAEILRQKQQLIVTQYIQGLRASSEIEIL